MHKNGKENVMKVKTLLLLLVLMAGIGGLGYYFGYWEKIKTQPDVEDVPVPEIEEPEEDPAPTKEDIQKEQKQLNKSIKIFQTARVKKMMSEKERKQLEKILNESTLDEEVRWNAEYAADVLYAKWCVFYKVNVDYSIVDPSEHSKCGYCDGKGDRECYSCYGDGICWRCKGSGKARASSSNDTSRYDYRYRRYYGRRGRPLRGARSFKYGPSKFACSCVGGKCGKCKGEGKITCKSCNGSGIVALDDYKRQLAIALEGIKEHIQENTKILKQMQEDEEKSVKPETEQK